ncbi:MAG: RIP metalloprotease RseP [Candidatus Marinimicrobia bacterium]|nr:RIP metalloprotease RseP [Candidatus Neomarinimicrobiota bacterium]|tara:strand:+ start:13654 stop:15189 length:1536 start_codon:yes stop_codon:yes gene_type:complete
MLLTIISFAFVISVLVFIHELGHYLAARSTGMRVEKFSVGFPPRFLSFTSIKGGWDFSIYFYKLNNKKLDWLPIYNVFIPIRNKKGSNTEYCLALLPMGGYVKVSGILDESIDSESTGAEYEYQSKKTWQKIWFTSAGVIFNFVLSFLIFCFLFFSNGYPKNKIESIFNKISNISIRNIKVNDSFLRGDDNYFTKINYVPDFRDDNGVKFIDKYTGRLYLQNLTGQKINEVEFTLPFYINSIEEGLVDSVNSINIKSINNKIVLNTINKSFGYPLNEKMIYLGRVYHDEFNHSESPSYKVLKPGDEVLSINKKSVKYYNDIAPLISQESIDTDNIKTIYMDINRQGELISVDLEPIVFDGYNQYGEVVKYGKIGITFMTEKVGFIECLIISAKTLFENIVNTFKGIFELITGQLSSKAVSGPIGIAKISGEFASKGFVSLLTLMAYLSISLGVINILPFPGLDGGHALIAIIEGIKGEKISPNILIRVQQFGMLILMGLFVSIILKDLGLL